MKHELNLSSEDMAKEIGLPYRDKITVQRKDDLSSERLDGLVMEGSYLHLWPINNWYSFFPEIWYQKKLGIFFKKVTSLKKVTSNVTAFSEIRNLAQILMQMIDIYDQYLDKPVVLNPRGFGIKLQRDKKIMGTLIITKDVVLEGKGYTHKNYANFHVNLFLDVFVGMNFGKCVNENQELQKKLLDFNEKVILKGLREEKDAFRFRPGINGHFQNDFVQPYELKHV